MQNDRRINLKDHYSVIENISDLNPYIQLPSVENCSVEELFYLLIESKAPRLHIEEIADYNNPTKTIKVNVINEMSKLFGQRKDDVLNYLKERIAETSNIIQKARYNYFIFILNNKVLFCQEAINYYQKALEDTFANTQRELDEFLLNELFKIICKLSIRINYKIDELKIQIKSYLADNNIADILKTKLFISATKNNLFSNKESEEFISFFINLTQSCSDTLWVEKMLEIALSIAKKNKNQQKVLEIYELLGDNELKKISPDDYNNICTAFYNETTYEKAIGYYKEAKCDQKLRDIWKLHRNNKKKKQYIRINIETKTSPELINHVKQLFEGIATMRTTEIVEYLIFCNRFLFTPNELLNSWLKAKDEFLYQKMNISIQADINFNHKKSNWESHNKFFSYYATMQDNLDLIFNFVLVSIQRKKLSYKKLHTILKNQTTFGYQHYKDSNGEKNPYTWLSMIDIGLESFFIQCNRVLKEKNPDWRVCIDILTLKFEGILRKILELNGANTTKFENRKPFEITNTSEIPLGQLLYLKNEDIKDAFDKSFNKDDLNFFQYVFTETELNIRNSVAHCLYLPSDYTYQKAMLIFLSILRLAKYIPQKQM